MPNESQKRTFRYVLVLMFLSFLLGVVVEWTVERYIDEQNTEQR